MFQTDRTKQSILIEGKTYTASQVHATLKEGEAKGWTDFHLELFRFLKDWFDHSETMTVHTSGSTGKPKSMLVQKRYLMQSACITCEYFGLKPKDKVLLCMSMNFIAGKMMVVRALVGGLDVYPVAPSGHPLKDVDLRFHFASMVPLQIYNALQNPVESERLQNIHIVLIGGGGIDPALETILKDFPNAVYASYGMAETLSHIALRRVNGADASLAFTPLPSVSLSLSGEGTLIIDAPMVNEKVLFTNDLAEIYADGSFRILGRKDHVIVTGGIKVQTETLESILSSFIQVPFAIASLPDPKFGEVVVLILEEQIDIKLLYNHLKPHQIPKKIVVIDAIPRTESGKIDRAALRAKLLL